MKRGFHDEEDGDDNNLLNKRRGVHLNLEMKPTIVPFIILVDPMMI